MKTRKFKYEWKKSDRTYPFGYKDPRDELDISDIPDRPGAVKAGPGKPKSMDRMRLAPIPAVKKPKGAKIPAVRKGGAKPPGRK